MQFDGDTGSDFHDMGGFSNMGGQGGNFTFKMNGQDMGGMGGMGMGGIDPN